jgi:pimeloyl-ACP methyl ester carboxylesterase
MPYADLTDVRCHYQLLGAGDPVVLIPGLGMTCDTWPCGATKLADSFSLILPDNRDIGLSIGKRPARTLADYAVDIIELLDYLQLDRAHVIGISLGGVIAQQLAMDHPSRVDRLVLLSSSKQFGPYLHEMAKLLGHAMRYFPTDVFYRTIDLLATSPQFRDSHEKEIEKKLGAAQEARVGRAALIRQMRCLACENDLNAHGDYHIVNPTLVIAGENDMLIPAMYARQTADAIPGSEFMLVNECGHNPLLEQPDLVAWRIREFLLRPMKYRNIKEGVDKLVMEEMV